MKISLVAPCYNEEGNLRLFYDTVKETFKLSKYALEIVFINDGSKDATYKILKEIFNENKKEVKVINFLHNFGKEAAIYAGLKETTGDYVCIIDTDCQQDPKYILEMANILENNDEVDMVAAKPSNEKDSKMLSFFKSNFYKIINKIATVPFYQGVSDFRVFRKNICEAILSLNEHNRFSKGIFSWVCPDIICVDYEVKERNAGTTKWSFFKLLKYAFDGIFAFSSFPLMISSFSGIFELFIAFIIGIVCIIKVIIGVPVTVTLLFFVVFLLASISSFNIWVIGQYISKIHTETLNRPIYIIKDILKT